MFWFYLFGLVLAVSAQTEVTIPPTTSQVTKPSTTSSVASVTEQTSTTKEPPVRIIDELRSLAHGVSSGKIAIIGDKVFQIPNFHFDGKAPTAFFMVGKGNKPNGNGTVVPLGDSTEALKEYNGQTIELTLPGNLTVQDIDWLVVWCVKYQQNLGYVFVNKGMFPYPPQTFGLNHKVTSGPVILVNKKTLFVPNFRYDGDHTNVRFWVGNGTEPSSEGVPILDETGSTQSLHSYQGRNLNLNLPDGISTDNIDYFGVWSIDEKINLGHVPIKGIEGVPDAPISRARTLVDSETAGLSMRVPKCCATDFVLTATGCEERASLPEFKPTFKVYEHNETHFSNESLDVSKIDFIPYVSAPNCQTGKYPLDEDSEEFALLLNTSLLVKGSAVAGILATDQFCLDFIEEDNSTMQIRILVCMSEYKIQKAMFVTYVTFTIISTFCFAITFFLYCFWLKVEDVHRKCFTGYVFTMTITFLALTIVQTADVENSGCEVLGFLFQVFMIASFTLLGILCFDIYIIVKFINNRKYQRRRKLWYTVVAIAVPLLFLIISLSRNLTPDVPNSFFKPQYLKNACHFEADSQRTILFYVPICLTMLVSTVCLIWTKILIVQNDKNHENDYFWLESGTQYKFMWRKHLIIYLMSLMWAVEAVIHLNYANANMLIAVDIVEASQGILVLLLFVVNRETRTQVVRDIKACRRKSKNAANCAGEEEIMMAHINGF